MTNKQLLTWWESLDHNKQYTCSDCGRIDSIAYVQPQHPFYADFEGQALCGDCINKRNDNRRKERKEQLAKAPRCQVSGCKIRGTLKVGSYNPVLMCRRHYNKANENMLKTVGDFFWLSWEMTGTDALRFAQK